MKTSSNTILITGGAGGIGYALAEEFLKRGNRIRICDKSKDSLERMKSLYPEIDVFRCDLADKASRIKLFDWAVSDGSLNVLVNNAGIQRSFDFTKSNKGSYDEGENEIEINLAAPIHLCELFIPHLLKKADAVLMNVSSSLAIVPDPRTPVYCACKAGVHALTRCIREQLLGSGVKVFEALPPAVDTGLNPEGRAVDPPPNLWSPAAYAAYVFEALESDIYEIYSPVTTELQKKNLIELYEYFKSPNNPR